MPRPIMNATTGLAWWAGTSSAGGSMSAEGAGDAERMDEIEDEMEGVIVEFITRVLLL